MKYARFALPRPDGLPNRRVLLIFPALVVLFGIIVVGFALNGTSSGEMYGRIYAGNDPALLAGHPELIRSDEWYVNTAWSISQVEQGLPEINRTMPGGMDAALPHDLPRSDWSVVFRPQLWGYLVFDVNHATAFKWWIAALTFIGAAYLFLVTVLPRRPLVAAALSVGFFFSPFFQWWFQTVIFWPMAWALVTMAAMLWAVRSDSRASRWIWAAPVAFLTVVMAMGIYAPFIVPIVLVVALFAIGTVIEQKRRGAAWLALLARAVPILIAGALGAVVTLIWLQTKQTTLNAFLATSYPGERLTPTGSSLLATGARTIGSSFSQSLSLGDGLLNINASEASTFFLIGAFLIPVVVWIVVRAARSRVPLPWTLMAMVGFILLIVAFCYIPGWNAIAHLLFLDRSMDARLRIGLGLASFVILAYVIRYFDDEKSQAGLRISVLSAVLFVLSQLAVALAVIHFGGRATLFRNSPLWWLDALASAAAIFFVARRRPALGTALFLAISVLSTAGVNPVYVGVFDLRNAPVTKGVQRVDAERPGDWVGVGGVETSAILMESGVTAFNGMQGAPSRTMWKEIDPTSQYKYTWNRLAGIGWVFAPGEPVVSNPAADQIVSTFDACSEFAQKHVAYVLSTEKKVTSKCLVADRSFPAPKQTFTIYRVIPKT
ncbi:DUF7657 domain-containing protein [Lacisediminihabitans changchengi]|uniref:YfhO family protein n=1 Tax=Lacisediminihabitans changchengi TaxID=2787634 RepID=A0A934SP23_9MICO|nr:hypothetical protein [Lacisediminihabitans changchengi]MBK4346463.1 hypothetical protein [Lacisediminihabitans changchengi]MBK4348909.1 hypothetical protein [Lacisediminihabitans changchengi]